MTRRWWEQCVALISSSNCWCASPRWACTKWQWQYMWWPIKEEGCGQRGSLGLVVRSPIQVRSRSPIQSHSQLSWHSIMTKGCYGQSRLEQPLPISSYNFPYNETAYPCIQLTQILDFMHALTSQWRKGAGRWALDYHSAVCGGTLPACRGASSPCVMLPPTLLPWQCLHGPDGSRL